MASSAARSRSRAPSVGWRSTQQCHREPSTNGNSSPASTRTCGTAPPRRHAHIGLPNDPHDLVFGKPPLHFRYFQLPDRGQTLNVSAIQNRGRVGSIHQCANSAPEGLSSTAYRFTQCRPQVWPPTRVPAAGWFSPYCDLSLKFDSQIAKLVPAKRGSWLPTLAAPCLPAK